MTREEVSEAIAEITQTFNEEAHDRFISDPHKPRDKVSSRNHHVLPVFPRSDPLCCCHLTPFDENGTIR